MTRPRIAFIGTGGTIASLGAGPLDLHDYAATGRMLDATTLLARVPEAQAVAEVLPVPYRAVPSMEIGWSDWQALGRLCARLAAEVPGLAGIVIGHGTATLEETAYALSLTLATDLPVVLVGAQRPASALSSDAGLNLVNAVRVAASPESRGLGVLVVLNDEIHAAREVSKVSTTRLHTFVSGAFGPLGVADGDRVVFHRRPLRRVAPGTPFDLGSEALPPRVDISFSYAGADGTAVRAFVAAGAQGIVAAGLAPGFVPPGEAAALEAAVGLGVTVVISTRGGRGRVVRSTRMAQCGFLSADDLTPQKARILLALGLAVTRDPARLAALFEEY